MLGSLSAACAQFVSSFAETVIAFLIASSSATEVSSFANVAALCLLSEKRRTFLPAFGVNSNFSASVITGGCIINCSEMKKWFITFSRKIRNM